jgi:hypothetical protein
MTLSCQMAEGAGIQSRENADAGAKNGSLDMNASSWLERPFLRNNGHVHYYELIA